MTKTNHDFSNLKKQFKRPIVLTVLIPWLVYAFYLTVLASPMYESQSQLVLKSSSNDSAFDPAALVLGSISGATVTDDAKLLEAYIHSRDMLQLLDASISLREHYTSTSADWFSRLSSSFSQEELLSFYQSHTELKIEQQSGVITIKTIAFEQEFAQALNYQIIKYAEEFINRINQDVAKAKLAFADQEHNSIEERLETAKSELLAFQTKYNLVDPTIEGAAFQQITYGLESALAQKRAELNAAERIMAPNAPAIINLRRDIAALVQQIETERQRISDASNADNKAMSTLIAEYSNLRIQLELSTQVFAASLASLEKTRTETYQQMQYLIKLESPSLPDDNRYPRVTYQLVLVGVVLLLVFGVFRIIIATIKEFSY